MRRLDREERREYAACCGARVGRGLGVTAAMRK
jgi:hypothetical protein